MASQADTGPAPRPSRPRVGRLLDAMHAAAAILTPDGFVLHANTDFLDMLEVPREQVDGTALEQLVPAEERETYRRLLAGSGARHGSHGEISLLRADGQPVFSLVSFRRLLPPSPDVVCLVAVDLTAQHHIGERLRREKEEAEARVEARTAELADANRALQAANETLRAVLEQAADGIIVRDAAGRVTFANAVARGRTRLPPEGTPLDVAPRIWGETLDASGNLLPPEAWPVARALQGETVTGVEFHRVSPAGSRYVLVNSAAPLKNDRGEVFGAVAISTDITARKQMETDLRQVLADREALLREVHHRVKNNLQMLSDLLFLQAQAVANPEGKGALEDSHSRVFAIARLHEQLYQAMEGGEVRLAEYLRRLVAGLEGLRPDFRIQLDLPPEDLRLDIDRALHAGLMVMELLTNAVKHAFPPGVEGEIGVRLRTPPGELELVVWDTGKGLSREIDWESAATFGLRILRLLARRLQASVTVATEHGTVFTIRFPRGGRGSGGAASDPRP